MVLEFVVREIVVQKDEYLDKNNQPLDAVDFWQGPDNEAKVQEFKRVKVQLEVRSGGKSGPMTLHCHPRSNTIRVMAKGLMFRPDEAFGTLWKRLTRSHHDALPSPYLIGAKPADGMCEVAVHDALWYAAILHQLREFGPIGTDNQLVGVPSRR